MYRLQCFGSATLFDAEGEEVHFRSRKHLALLLYLCAHRSRSLTRAHLAALFWDSEESLARHSLSQALYDLRKRVPPLSLDGRGGTLRLGDAPISFEAGRLEAAVKEDRLDLVVELYRGEFAPNLESVGTRRFQRWLESERSRYGTLGRMSLRRYAAACDRKGQWGEVCLAALRLVKLDPLDEVGHRALMKALWLQGDQHSALQHYAEVEPTLLEELPDGPSAETLELIERIRSSRPPPTGPRSRPETILPLTGRGRELETLRRGLAELSDSGSGRVMVVRGEAGIGKTRLLQELKRVAEVEGFACFESRCYPAESDVAYGPVLDAIEPIAARISDANRDTASRYHQLGYLFPNLFERESAEERESVDPAVRRRRLFEEVTDLLRRTVHGGPLVWIVEDVHWIDAASASLLHYVARRLLREPLMFVLSLRSGQPIREPARLLTEEMGPSLRTEAVELSPLPREAIRELLRNVNETASHPAVIPFAERYSGGNPFYALEILRAANDARSRGELPPGNGLITDRLRNLLTLRLRGLSSRALRVLEAVALLERYASPDHVSAVAGLTPDGTTGITAELRRRHLLREREGRIEFAHDIAREFVYSNLGLLQRSALHLTVAEVLAGHQDVSPASLARHFERGGDRARAYEFAMRAARASSSSSAHSEAASMAALAASMATHPDTRFEALRLQAEAELAAGRFQEAESHFDALLSLYPELPAEQRVPLRLSIMRAKVESSDWQGASACLRILEREIPAVVDSGRRVEWELEARALMLKVALLTKDDAGARRTRDTIRKRAEEADRASELSTQARAEALCSQAVYATFLESSSRAADLLSEAKPLQASISQTLRQQLALYETLVHIRLGNWDKAYAAATGGLTFARRLNDSFHIATFLNNLGCIALEQGAWDDALTHSTKSWDMFTALELNRYSALPPLLNQANVYFYQSLLSRAVPLYELALEIASESRASWNETEIHAALGLIALQQGSETNLEAHVTYVNANSTTGAVGYDRFIVDWFRAFLDLTCGIDPIQISERLLSAASEESRRDRINWLKLRWLNALLCEEPTSELTGELAGAGLSWFVGFTRRWLQMAKHHRWNRSGGLRVSV